MPPLSQMVLIWLATPSMSLWFSPVNLMTVTATIQFTLINHVVANSLLLDLKQTPAATVLPMSRTAKRSSGKVSICSMAMGLVGWKRMRQVVTGLEEGRVGFLAGLVGLLQEFHELHSDLSGVSVEHRGVANGDGLGDVHELICPTKVSSSHEGWLAVGVAGHAATANVGERGRDLNPTLSPGSALSTMVWYLNGLHFAALGGGVEDHSCRR